MTNPDEKALAAAADTLFGVYSASHNYHCWVPPYRLKAEERLAEAISAYLDAVPVAATQQPVAWRCSRDIPDGNGNWFYFSGPPTPSHLARNVQPLYLAPSPSTGEDSVNIDPKTLAARPVPYLSGSPSFNEVVVAFIEIQGRERLEIILEPFVLSGDRPIPRNVWGHKIPEVYKAMAEDLVFLEALTRTGRTALAKQIVAEAAQ